MQRNEFRGLHFIDHSIKKLRVENVRGVLGAIVTSLVLAGTAQAQESGSAGNGSPVETSAGTASTGTDANASNNPLTPRDQVQAVNYAIPRSEGNGSRWSDLELLKLFVPYSLFGTSNSVRLYAPFSSVPTAQGGRDYGLGDMTLYNLTMKKINGIEFGVGPVLVMPTASEASLGTGKWQAGISILGIKTWDWGLFGTLVWYEHSFAGDSSRPTVQSIIIQPLSFYNVTHGYYVRTSGVWHFGLGTQPSWIPIGFGAGRTWTSAGGSTFNLFIEPQYSVYHSGTGAPKGLIQTGLAVQF